MSNILILSFVFMCSFLSPQNQTDFQDIKFKYLALGDSYTIGESVDFMDRFPVQLTNKLKLKGFNLDYPEIMAKTGWTTDELLEGIEEAHRVPPYDLVTLLIGVNNQYRGRDIENYKTEFETLLKNAISFAGEDTSKVIVISIPDYGVTPFGQKKGRKRIAEEIDQFNLVNKAISDEYNIAYVNVTEISRKAYRRPNLVAEDGLHPSGEMYGLWVEEILPVANLILERHAN